MSLRIFKTQSIINGTPEQVYAWHRRKFAFERIMPPWENTSCEIDTHNFANGMKCGFTFKIGPIKFNWLASYRDVIENEQFVDVQHRGPFKTWIHTHRFEPTTDGKTLASDQVQYQLPLGKLGDFFGNGYAHRRLVAMFARRHKILQHDFLLPRIRSQKILVSGATGLVGRALIPLLTTQGHQVWTLTRKRQPGATQIYWNPRTGEIESEKLQGFDTVIHLAGESVMGRWSERKKTAIYESRINGTKLLVDALKNLASPPKFFLSASAIGYYGDQGDREITETGAKGSGFLSHVCQDWENIARTLDEKTRTVQLRIGIVLSPKGGALKQMLLPFKLGTGGRMGHGQQYMSWISIDDLVGLIYHCLTHEQVRGPVNAVSPTAVTNEIFSKTLAKTLSRPCLVPVPSAAISLAFGELGRELLLSSLRVTPQAALQSGYHFVHPNLEDAFVDLLGTAQK